jgi:hypothetical protein
MVSLARELAHPHTLALALYAAALTSIECGDAGTARDLAEESLQLCATHGLALQMAMSTVALGWAIGERGQIEAGLSQIHQGMAACRAGGIEAGRVTYLTYLASLYLQAGRTEEGFRTVTEALARVQKIGDELCYETWLYQIKGELTLQQFNVQGSKFKVTDPRPPAPKAKPKHVFSRRSRSHRASSPSPGNSALP